MEREATALGLPCRQPDPFPQNSLLAARVALLARGHPWEPTFVKAVFRLEFGEGRDISDAATIRSVLVHLGLDADRILHDAQTDVNKAALRAACDEARERGIFGAPTFITAEGEMFWGNDRLERALDWAVKA